LGFGGQQYVLHGDMKIVYYPFTWLLQRQLLGRHAWHCCTDLSIHRLLLHPLAASMHQMEHFVKYEIIKHFLPVCKLRECDAG